MELLQGRNQGELRTVYPDVDDQSTSYTVRQQTPAQKDEGESTSSQRGIRSYLRSAIDSKEISARPSYDDLTRKSDVLPPYINLLQAASTYGRVRSSDFDFTSVSLTTAFFFERNVRRIGRGATFQVYRWPAEYFPRHYGIPFNGPESARSTGDFVALKSISRLKRNSAAPTRHTERAITNFIKELQVLGHPPLRAHPNIPNLLGVAWEDGADGETVWPVICVEYAAYGTLAEFQRSRAILTALEKNRVLLDVGIGMGALHMCGIVHGDLKAGNVLIFPHSSSPTRLIAKISDFADVWIIKDNPKDRKVMVSRGTSPQAGNATNSYRRFVLDVKSSEQVLEWALDFSASLEAKGSNSAGIAKVFKLTLQREPNKRSRVWKTVYDHLQSNFDAQDERLRLRNLYMMLCYQRGFSWKRQAGSTQLDFSRESKEDFDGQLQLRTRNTKKEISGPIKDEQQIGITDFPELRACADMEQIDIDFDKLDGLDHRVKNQTLKSVLLAQKNDWLRMLLQFHLSERSAQSFLFLFQCYLYGFGVPRNSHLALENLREAAEQESEEAAALVKRLHDALAIDMPADQIGKLHHYLKLGAASGSIVAEEDLETLYPEIYKKLPALKRNETEGPGVNTPFEKNGMSVVGSIPRIPWSDPEDLERHVVSEMKRHGIHHIDQMRFPGGNGYLHMAAERSTFEGLTAIFHLGASQDLRNNLGETPLLVASRCGNWKAAALLVLSQTSPIIATELDENPLHWLPVLEKSMSQDGYGRGVATRGLAEAFVQKGANPNQVGRSSCSFAPIALQGSFGYTHTSLTKVHSRAIPGTPVHRAIAYGAVESLKSLLLFGGKTIEMNVVFSGPAGDAFSVFASPIVSPVQWAARLHRAECLKVCLDHMVKSEGRGTVASQGCFDGGVFLNDIDDMRSGNTDATALATKNCAKGGRYSLLSEAIQALPDAYLHRLGIHGARHVQEMKDTIEVLIQNGAGLENLSGWGENCVGTAVLHGNASTLRYLLEVTGKTFIHLPLNMNVAKLTTTPLGIACRRGDQEIFDVLLEFGANVGASAPVIDPKDCCISRKRLAPLHVCAISRHQNIIAFARALLDRGAEVDPGDEFLPTPLYFALLEGEFELAQLLIDCGADMRARQYSEDGRTYKTLVGAVISQIFSQAPFSTGCDPVKILDFLLQSQSRCDSALLLEPMNSNNSTIFHIAAAASNTDLADPDEISGRNLWSSLIGHINCPKDFFNTRNIHGETPLHVACASLDLAACEALLQAGCCATGVNVEGKTPREVAKVALCEGNVDAELMRWNRDRIIRLLPLNEKPGTLP